MTQSVTATPTICAAVVGEAATVARRYITRLLLVRTRGDEILNLVVENPTRLKLCADAEHLATDEQRDLSHERISFFFRQLKVTGEDELRRCFAVNDEQLAGLVELRV